MTQYTLPFLFLNLGGEMIYILDQRLRAQNIAIEKSRKVLDDLVRIMFNPRFMEELFKPQEIYNKAALKALFHDLAHASIMRLNETSMNKLYDLMTMVFKWQIFSSSHPRELILITLNHLDSMRSLVSCSLILKQLDKAYFMFIKTYGQMTCGELQRVRYSLLNFLQDVRVRVSLLLRQRLQNTDGSFVIPLNLQLFHGCETPGQIRVFSKEGIPIDLITFNPGGKYVVAEHPGSTEMRGLRNTSLGTNIYSASRTESDNTLAGYEGHESYRKEINLLVAQLGGDSTKIPDETFSLHNSLFSTIEEVTSNDDQPALVPETPSIEPAKQEAVDTTNAHTEALSKILAEMQPSIPKDQSEFDLLDLMDDLN
ncbi:protein OSCP1 [Halyomorpha halys]|uniref:protein OSCP1 n=1 Tax=Halyomorpha halys TaxID=286706 RepID=UPI0006D528E6|nr:protein OSCP1 [Halyomorpha halys]